MTTNPWLGVSLLMLVLTGVLPPAGLAQPLPTPASPLQGSQPAPVEPAPVMAPVPDSFYPVAAVVATGLNIAAREVMCGVGEVLGFFTLAVIRLPVWALTLGDRFGSSEGLDRLGTSIIENACDGPWIVTPDQMKELARPLEGRAMAGQPAAESEGP